MFPKATRREILLLLAAKAAALTAIYFLFFTPADKTPLGPRAVEAQLLSDTSHRDDHDGHR